MNRALDFRAELARRRLPVYQFVAWVQLHPSRLSAVLTERTRLSPQLAERIVRAFEELERGRSGDEGWAGSTRSGAPGTGGMPTGLGSPTRATMLEEAGR
jgi:hypothetical protein